jgi:hypothetical protein
MTYVLKLVYRNPRSAVEPPRLRFPAHRQVIENINDPVVLLLAAGLAIQIILVTMVFCEFEP